MDKSNTRQFAIINNHGMFFVGKLTSASLELSELLSDAAKYDTKKYAKTAMRFNRLDKEYFRIVEVENEKKIKKT